MLSNVDARPGGERGQETLSVRGKHIVIVGDASTSGCAIARLLASYGAVVFFTANNEEELGSTLAEIAHAKGQGEGMVANLNRAEDVELFFKRAGRRLGKVDGVVYHLPVEAGDTSKLGPDMAMQAVIHMLRASGGGHVVVVGKNQAGRRTTSALRRELRGFGIRVTRIEPGLSGYRNLAQAAPTGSVDDVARCVYNSLVQPFAVDMIFIQDQFVGTLL